MCLRNTVTFSVFGKRSNVSLSVCAWKTVILNSCLASIICIFLLLTPTPNFSIWSNRLTFLKSQLFVMQTICLILIFSYCLSRTMSLKVNKNNDIDFSPTFKFHSDVQTFLKSAIWATFPLCLVDDAASISYTSIDLFILNGAFEEAFAALAC